MKKNPRPKPTREERRQRARDIRAQAKQDVRKHPLLFTIYVVLRFLVLAVLVLEAVKGDYYNVFLCVLTLVLFMIPTFVEHRLHIDVPNTLEIIILLFIFSAEILGEIQEYYLLFPFWDTMLHTINGFLMAAIGIAMVDILNRSRKFKVRLSPAFVALVAFCFSMTVGVVWEFFEYGMDVFFHTDMQKDTWINTIGPQCGPARGRGQRGGKRGNLARLPGHRPARHHEGLVRQLCGRGDFLGDWRAVHHGPGQGLVCQEVHPQAESGRAAAPAGRARAHPPGGALGRKRTARRKPINYYSVTLL